MLGYKEALEITGGLSYPSKMPCPSFGLSARLCKRGSKLAKVEGTVCNKCYAYRGFYNTPSVKNAHSNREEGITHENWVEAMVLLIKGNDYFRWFDSGDIRGLDHLKKIVGIVELTPNTKHWLPTKEISIVKLYYQEYGEFPENLILRLSSDFINQYPKKIKANILYSVVSEEEREEYHNCPSTKQHGKCMDCRACWDKSVEIVSYKLH